MLKGANEGKIERSREEEDERNGGKATFSIMFRSLKYCRVNSQFKDHPKAFHIQENEMY
jgi:hypothetical protein